MSTYENGIYRYRANAKLVAGGPMYSVMGPAPCKDCGTFVWYAHSQTRDAFPDGRTVRGVLAWREKGGKVHKHIRQKRYTPEKRIGRFR